MLENSAHDIAALNIEAVVSPAVICGFHGQNLDHSDPTRFLGSVFDLGVNTGHNADADLLTAVASKLEHLANLVNTPAEQFPWGSTMHVVFGTLCITTV